MSDDFNVHGEFRIENRSSRFTISGAAQVARQMVGMKIFDADKKAIGIITEATLQSDSIGARILWTAAITDKEAAKAISQGLPLPSIKVGG